MNPRTIQHEDSARCGWSCALGYGLAKDGLRLRTKIDGMALIIPVFEQAGMSEEGKRASDTEIDAVFAMWVE